jgi:DNA invertase Pin-like site-specific DNA recombinase
MDTRAVMATIFYARVSTTEQTLDHQVKQARDAGFRIDEVLADHGVSGVQQRLKERPEGRRLYDKLRHGDTLVVRWLDRLGRNYEDVTDAVRHFIRVGVTIRTVINDMTFDGATSDPVQQAVRDSMIAFLAATAQAQAEATKFAQQAGIEAAKNDPRKYRGRKPTYSDLQLQTVLSLHHQGNGVTQIGRETGLSRQTIYRIIGSRDRSIAAVARWNN